MNSERNDDERRQTVLALRKLTDGPNTVLSHSVESVEGMASANLIRDIALIQHADMLHLAATLEALGQELIATRLQVSKSLNRMTNAIAHAGIDVVKAEERTS